MVTAYDGMLAGFRHLDTETLTVYAVGPGYVPDTAHVDITDVTDLITDAEDTATATLTEAVDEAVLDVTDVSIPLDGVTDVGWVVWADASDNLVAYEPGPVGAATDPLDISYPSGLLRGTR